VPTTAFTVTAAVAALPIPAGVRHVTSVLVDQLAVVHEYTEICVDAVESIGMKFRPAIVADVPPVVGEFALFGRYADEKTGASNVMLEDAVPASAETVSMVERPFDRTTFVAEEVRQIAADIVVHDTVEH
jgi:hypothetical protein